MSLSNVVLIQAGGIGSRVNSEIPKQFIEVHGKPIVIHTLEKFQSCQAVDSIFIACLDSWETELQKLCIQYRISKVEEIVSGGQTIYQSTHNCLDLIKERYSLDTLVLIHEAVRPLVSDEMITDSFRTAKEYGNAVACYECIDEVGIDKDGTVKDLVSDSRLVSIQNPHTFRLDKLCEAYGGHEDIGNKGTAVLMFKQGETLYRSKGCPDCFKITYAEDVERFAKLCKE